MGTQWTKQRLTVTPLEVIQTVRNELRSGFFNRHAWDHNHPDHRPGRSNKQIKILGAMLLDDPDCTMDEAWAAVLEIAA